MRKIASVLMVVGCCLAACGGDDDDDDVPDGAPIVPDAMAPDAAPVTGLLTVTVYDEGHQLEPGADVIVQHADGTVASTAKTDENGQATPTVTAGDMVTVAQSFASKGTIYTLLTWTDVEPGDHLTRGTPRGSDTGFGTVSVTTPGGVGGAGIYVATSALHFFGFDSCFDQADAAQPTPELVINLSENCHADHTKVPVLLLAQDETQRSLAYAADAEVTLTGAETAVSFAAWREDFLPFTSTVTNLPAEAAAPERHLVLHAATGELFELALDVDTTPGSAIADVPMDLAESWFYGDGIRENDGERWRFVAGAMPIPTTLSLDAATGLLAGIASLGFAVGDDVARFGTMWAYKGNGDSSRDAVLVDLELDLDAGFGFWTFVVPPGVTSVTLPALPDALAEFRPSSTPRFGTVMVIDADSGGYDELRQAMNGSTDPLGQAATTPPPGATVRVSRQSFFTGE